MISILIPVFNTPSEWLYECFESIKKQTFTDFEVIIINDGSNDITSKYLDNINDNRFKVYHLEKNIGIAKALNFGIDKCKFEFIARMDGDDIMLPDRLKLQYEYLINNKNVDLVSGNLKTYHKSIDGWVVDNVNITYHPSVITKEIIKHRAWFINHPCVMFRKSSVLSIGAYNTEIYGYADDFELWYRMVLNGMVLHNMDDIVLIYRISPNSLSHNFNKDNMDFIKKLQDKI